MNTKRRRLLILPALISMAMGGCAAESGPERFEVSGTVTVDGRPLASGIISMVPEGDGPATGAEIADGRFQLTRERGPSRGPHNVRVTSQPQKSLVPTDEPPRTRILRTTTVVSGDTDELAFEL